MLPRFISRASWLAKSRINAYALFCWGFFPSGKRSSTTKTQCLIPSARKPIAQRVEVKLAMQLRGLLFRMKILEVKHANEVFFVSVGPSKISGNLDVIPASRNIGAIRDKNV
jgi:hypothetical protein